MILSCKNESHKKVIDKKLILENNNANKKNIIFPEKNYKPEYPLARFYYEKINLNKEIDTIRIRKGDFKNLNIDTTSSKLTISFIVAKNKDCEINGQIDIRKKHQIKSDTIYLDFFDVCSKNIEMVKLYYGITDELSYNKSIFVPRYKN